MWPCCDDPGFALGRGESPRSRLRGYGKGPNRATRANGLEAGHFALSLGCVFLVEITMIFAVMIFSFQTNFMPHPYYMFDAFFSSLTILLPVISPVVTPISLVGLAMYYGEIFISLIFFIVIIQRTLALFTIKD